MSSQAAKKWLDPKSGMWPLIGITGERQIPAPMRRRPLPPLPRFLSPLRATPDDVCLPPPSPAFAGLTVASMGVWWKRKAAAVPELRSNDSLSGEGGVEQVGACTTCVLCLHVHVSAKVQTSDLFFSTQPRSSF